MFWMLLIALTVLGGVTALKVASGKQPKALTGGTPKALPSGAAEPAAERGLEQLTVGDVLVMDGRDFLCEGVVAYDEDGKRWRIARVVDGAAVQWLGVGLRRASDQVDVFEETTAFAVGPFPSEMYVVEGETLTLERRGTATCKFHGDVGAMSRLANDRIVQHVERSRWWLYRGGPGLALLIEQWGDEFRVLKGHSVSTATLDLIVGS